jgi:hypothetical protein
VPGGSSTSGTARRPKCKVRARPLSETNPEVAAVLEQAHIRPRDGALGKTGASVRSDGVKDRRVGGIVDL